MVRKTRRHRTREEWTRIIDDQDASGLSQRAYCERHGITVSSFHNAKARLRETALVAVAQPAFVGVTVDESPVSPPTYGWDVELTLGDGVVLRLRRTV